MGRKCLALCLAAVACALAAALSSRVESWQRLRLPTLAPLTAAANTPGTTTPTTTATEATTTTASTVSTGALPVAPPEGPDALCRCAQQGGKTPPRQAAQALEELLQEMRRELRFYIYPVDLHCKHHVPANSNRGYTVEYAFYLRASLSSMRVLDPSKASVFYIPSFTACWRSQGKSRRDGGLQAHRNLEKMVHEVAQQPYFERYGGHRHFWLSTHDMGKVEPLGDSAGLLERLARNGTALVNTADDEAQRRRNGFDAAQDVALVCNSDGTLAAAPGGLKTRRISVFFAGKYGEDYVPVRYKAIRSIERAKLRKKPRFKAKMGFEAYVKSLSDSELCLAPRGSRVWSPRLFEMIWFGCVPVIIATGYHLPMSCFFDWSSFSIFIEDQDADKAGEIVRRVLEDPTRLEAMRRNLAHVRKRFIWNKKETAGDAFELAMLEIYLKQQRRC